MPSFIVKNGPEKTATKTWLFLLYVWSLLSQDLCLFSPCFSLFPVVSCYLGTPKQPTKWGYRHKYIRKFPIKVHRGRGQNFPIFISCRYLVELGPWQLGLPVAESGLFPDFLFGSNFHTLQTTKHINKLFLGSSWDSLAILFMSFSSSPQRIGKKT